MRSGPERRFDRLKALSLVEGPRRSRPLRRTIPASSWWNGSERLLLPTQATSVCPLKMARGAPFSQRAPHRI